jgi:isochorismate synthase
MAFEEKWKCIALVRFPNEKVVAFAGENDPIDLKTIDPKKPGFLYAPFDPEKGVYQLNPEKDMHRILNFISNVETDVPFGNDSMATGVNEYSKAAENLLAQLHNGSLQKVILSRIIEHPHATTQKVKDFFDLLCDAHPDACVHLFVHRDAGIWLGASPEVLLDFKKEILQTTALAATRKYDDKNLADVCWNEKEIQEHELVSDFIADILWHQPGINWLEENCIETIQAGSVIHMLTRFQATLDSDFNWINLLVKLHPTPAVCGLPVKAARQAIEQNEPHQRFFYTGFFGTYQQNEARLYVNLRCLQWFREKVNVYVGGGLTSLSEVDSEWEETSLKGDTILKILQQN